MLQSYLLAITFLLTVGQDMPVKKTNGKKRSNTLLLAIWKLCAAPIELRPQQFRHVVQSPEGFCNISEEKKCRKPSSDRRTASDPAESLQCFPDTRGGQEGLTSLTLCQPFGHWDLAAWDLHYTPIGQHTQGQRSIPKGPLAPVGSSSVFVYFDVVRRNVNKRELHNTHLQWKQAVRQSRGGSRILKGVFVMRNGSPAVGFRDTDR